jgi:hypothetical protein
MIINSKTKKGMSIGKSMLGLTGLGSILDTADLIKKLYQLKDQNRPDNFLAKFDIDDEVSQIVDNDLESDFIEELIKKIESNSDSKKIGNFNMTDHLRGYLAKRFNNRTVVGYSKTKK